MAFHAGTNLTKAKVSPSMPLLAHYNYTTGQSILSSYGFYSPSSSSVLLESSPFSSFMNMLMSLNWRYTDAKRT